MSSFPTEPWRRRCIILLTKSEQRQWEIDGNTPSSPEVAVLRMDEAAGISLVGTPGLRPGTLLLQSPSIDLEYAEVSEAKASFALARHNDFCTCARILGAKAVRVEELSVQTRDRTLRFAGSAGFGEVSAKLQGSNEQALRVARSLAMSMEFEGGEPDIGAARQFAAQRSLVTDAHVRFLLDAFGEVRNRPKNMELQLSLTQDVARTFKIAGSLKLPTGQLSADVHTALRDTQDYDVKLQVRF